MLKRVNEHLPPHKTPPARHLSAHLFSRPGSALLAKERARKPVLDVQHRQSDIGARTFSREAGCDQARFDLDDSWVVCLGYLCGAGLGCVLVFNARARWWAGGGVDCVETGGYGSNVVALGVWMVPGRASVIAVFYGSCIERESRTRSPAGLGANVSVVLVVLARSDRVNNSHPMAIRPPALEYLAI